MLSSMQRKLFLKLTLILINIINAQFFCYSTLYLHIFNKFCIQIVGELRKDIEYLLF